MADTMASWLFRTKVNPRARIRLFCFPYAGAGARIYRDWSEMLPDDVEICALQLPGRETRIQEKPFTRMSPLVAGVRQAIDEYLDLPFAFFGHSMGALLAFEICRMLRNTADQQPVHLFVSGRMAPQLADPNPPIHDLSEASFIKELRQLNGTPQQVIESTELMQLVMPTLRADIAVCETYHYHHESPLGCPISAYGGLQDKNVDRCDLEGWSAQTTASFVIRMFPGDHFFIDRHRRLVLQMLHRELRGIVASLPNVIG